MENPSAECPRCRAPIPTGAPHGLCPKCLLAGAAGEAGATAAVPPPEAGYPDPAAVAAAFPDLEIIESIGAGGMGIVFKARQPRLDRFVALKILLPHLGRSADFASRFVREARLLARLSHPNIVTVHDFGEAGGFYFLLMEYVDGVNLRQAMSLGKFTPVEALGVVPKICEALQYAHDDGILHRDIKPENILIDSRGRVKIADFGIAKLVSDTPAGSFLTGTGARLGTPVYMAPEQIEKPGAVDHRADIYSLGVVFYEMLTGELPLGRFAPPSARSDVDARIDDIVLRALEKERELRQQSATEMRTQVEGVGALGLPPAAPQPRPDFEAVRKLVANPAFGLQITGIISWVTIPLAFILGWSLEPKPQVAGAANIVVSFGIIPLIAGTIMFLAGSKMRRLEARSFAIAAGILPIVILAIKLIASWSLQTLAINPADFVGAPIGLWVLAVLGRRDVTAAFNASDQHRFSPGIPPAVPVPVIGAAAPARAPGAVPAVAMAGIATSMPGGGHHATADPVPNLPPPKVDRPRSVAAIVGAIFTFLSLLAMVPVGAVAMYQISARVPEGPAPIAWVGMGVGVLTLVGVIPILAGTVLGLIGMRDVRRGKSGAGLAVFAGMTWPLLAAGGLTWLAGFLLLRLLVPRGLGGFEPVWVPLAVVAGITMVAVSVVILGFIRASAWTTRRGRFAPGALAPNRRWRAALAIFVLLVGGAVAVQQHRHSPPPAIEVTITDVEVREDEGHQWLSFYYREKAHPNVELAFEARGHVGIDTVASRSDATFSTSGVVSERRQRIEFQFPEGFDAAARQRIRSEAAAKWVSHRFRLLPGDHLELVNIKQGTSELVGRVRAQFKSIAR